MANDSLQNTRVAVLVMDGVEETELTQPIAALKAAGASIHVISAAPGTIQTFRHHTPSIDVAVDKTFDSVSPEEYDALLLPGGALNADALRVVPEAQAFAVSFDRAGKPIAAICHAPWLLASADLLEGRTLTSFASIHDDIENAGGAWKDEAVVHDGNLVTSRQPEDLPEFNAEMLALFASARRGQAAGAR